MKRRLKFLPFSPPLIEKEEIREVTDTLRSEWITTGPKTLRFEEEFRRFVQAPAALAVNSCTAALHLALTVSNVGAGDEVLTTPMTFCSGVNVIEHAGAKPVLADVDPQTLNIDPEKISAVLKKAKHRKKIKAMIVMHYGGQPCEMGAISKIAQKYGITVIEDAAHALPAKYKGTMVGGISDFTAFSFYATKNLTTAEGGMLTARDPKMIAKARILSLHGMSRDSWHRYSAHGSWRYKVTAAGFKYNLTDIQSSLGIVQLRKLPQFQKARRRIVRQYQKAFASCTGLQIPAESPFAEHAWHLYPLRLHSNRLKIRRNRFIEELKRRNIGSSVHFIPIHLHPYYRKKYGYQADDFPVAYAEYQRLISLPLAPRMTDHDTQDVIEAVKDIEQKYSKR